MSESKFDKVGCIVQILGYIISALIFMWMIKFTITLL